MTREDGIQQLKSLQGDPSATYAAADQILADMQAPAAGVAVGSCRYTPADTKSTICLDGLSQAECNVLHGTWNAGIPCPVRGGGE